MVLRALRSIGQLGAMAALALMCSAGPAPVSMLRSALDAPAAVVPSTAPPVVPMEAVALGTVEPLARGYGLGVVDVPPVPVDLAAEPVGDPMGGPMGSDVDGELEASMATVATVAAVPSTMSAGACPLEVRAIVGSDEGTFAIVADGEGSRLVRGGEGFRTPRGWVAIRAVGADYVRVQYRQWDLRCPLSPDSER